MNILIDTQILIWSFDINSPLSVSHKKILENPENIIYVSQVSLMELAIKKNIKKLPDFLPDIEEIANQIAINGFELLKLKDEHIFSYQDLPVFNDHKDPFDRFLIAVAKHENCAIISTDAKFKLYSSLVRIL